MADIQAKNQENLIKQSSAKAKAATDMLDTHGKLKLEKIRLQQSEIIHGDKLQRDTLMKGLDLRQDQKRQQHDLNLGQMDIQRQREQEAMKMAKEQNQAAAQQLHEVAMENQRAKNAREAQFLEPPKDKEQ